MEESIRSQIIEKAKDYGYKSAKFRLALVKDDNRWKILIAKIFLDVCEPKKNQTLLKEENFVLEDIWISFNEFEKFINYLGNVYIGDISKEGKVEISDNLLFHIGNYKLCFVGNFPGRQIRFLSRQAGENHYGIKNPFYYGDYSIHASVTVEGRPELDLTGAEIPLKSAIEALNYFWEMKYEEHSDLSHYCSIYMPIFEGSIVKFEIIDKEIKIKFENNDNLVKVNKLSVGIIAKNSSGLEHRKKYNLQSNELKIKLKFNPNNVNVYLYMKDKKIDEYEYYDYQQPRIPLRNKTVESPFVENGENAFLDSELIDKMPIQIQNLLIEGETAFNSKSYRATAIMFRSAIEEGVTLILKKIGKEKELQNNKMEIGLDRKINLIAEFMPTFRQAKSELKDVKWFGDKATHEASMPINEQDILNNLEPKLRLILAKFAEELT
jgi:hypothetical protein